jgi:hypothetical protein
MLEQGGTAMETKDLRQLPRNELGVIGAGALALLFSFLPYYGAKYGVGAFHASATVNAWHGTALLGMLLVVAAAAVAAMQAFSPGTLPKMSVSVNFVVLALSAAGAALVVIRSFTLPSGGGFGVSYGIRWGAYLLIVACLAQAVFAVLKFRGSGEALPWQHDSAAAPMPPPAAPPAG